MDQDSDTTRQGQLQPLDELFSRESNQMEVPNDIFVLYLDLLRRFLSDSPAQPNRELDSNTGWITASLITHIEEIARVSIRNDAILLMEAAHEANLSIKEYVLNQRIKSGMLCISINGITVDWNDLYQDEQIMNGIHVNLAQNGLVTVIISKKTIDRIIEKTGAKKVEDKKIGGSVSVLPNGCQMLYIQGENIEDNLSVAVHEMHHRIFNALFAGKIDGDTDSKVFSDSLIKANSGMKLFIDELIAYMTTITVDMKSTTIRTHPESFSPNKISSFIYKFIVEEDGDMFITSEELLKIGKNILSMVSAMFYVEDGRAVNRLSSAMLNTLYSVAVLDPDASDEVIAKRISREIARTLDTNDVTGMLLEYARYGKRKNYLIGGLSEILTHKGISEEDALCLIQYLSCIEETDINSKRQLIADVLSGGNISSLLESQLQEPRLFYQNLIKLYRNISNNGFVTEDALTEKSFRTLARILKVDQREVIKALGNEMYEQPWLTWDVANEFVSHFNDEQDIPLNLKKCEREYIASILNLDTDKIPEAIITYLNWLDENNTLTVVDQYGRFSYDKRINYISNATDESGLHLIISELHWKLLEKPFEALTETEREERNIITNALGSLIAYNILI